MKSLLKSNNFFDPRIKKFDEKLGEIEGEI